MFYVEISPTVGVFNPGRDLTEETGGAGEDQAAGNDADRRENKL